MRATTPGDQEQQKRARAHDSTSVARKPGLPPAGVNLSPSDVLGMQISVGNRAVTRMLSRSAATPASGQTIQRRIMLGDAEVESLPWLKRRQGSGPHRNVGQMLNSQEANYYFENEAEMLNYANKKTDNIGYVEKQKAWIRLPEEFLVLGEDHSGTTLMDIVRATGTNKYRYEPFNDIPPELLANSKRMRQAKEARDNVFKAKAGAPKDTRNHAGDQLLPKIVVGLAGAGLKSEIEKAVRDFLTPPLPGSQAKEGEEGYSRAGAEIKMFHLGLLTAAKSAKNELPSQPMWDEHAAVFNETAKMITANKPLSRTPFISAIAAGTFTLNQFLESFKAAARAELVTAGKDGEFAAFETKNQDLQASKGVNEFEKMREFWMFQKIQQAQAGGDKLYGMGDVHRGHLEDILDDDGILVQKIAYEGGMPSDFTPFTVEQKAKYPQ